MQVYFLLYIDSSAHFLLSVHLVLLAFEAFW